MAVEQLQLLRVHGAGNILLLFCQEGWWMELSACLGESGWFFKHRFFVPIVT